MLHYQAAALQQHNLSLESWPRRPGKKNTGSEWNEACQMDTGAGSGTHAAWQGVTHTQRKQKDRVGHAITHYNSLKKCYDQSGYPERKLDITLLRSLLCAKTTYLLILFLAFWVHSELFYIPSNINNQYLGFNAVYCTCQVCMSQSSNPQLQGRLTKALLKKACQSRAPIWLAVVFVELSGFCWLSWHFFMGLCCWLSELPAVVVCRGHV